MRTRVAAEGRRRRGDDRGYALTLAALLIIPLMSIVSLGVDLGAWYVQGQQNQRAADAAALAGVVWLPDSAKAEQVALEAARRNGFEDGVNATITVEEFGPTKLKVTITTDAEQYFSSMFVSGFEIQRASIAEYVPAAALGSPRNALGTGNLAVTDPDGFWLAVSGRCSVAENGDLLNARFQGAYPGGAYPPNCNGQQNPDYTGSYFFGVTVRDAPGVPITVEAYDASYNPDGAIDLEMARPSNMTTQFRLRDSIGPIFDPAGHAILSTMVVSSRDATYTGQWRQIATIADPQPGTYIIEVSGSDPSNTDFGSNSFALRARTGGAYSSCSTLTTAPDYAPVCPQVHAIEDLPVYANLSFGSNDMYLAEIVPGHAGKAMLIDLFDVGEGAQSIQVIDPNGDVAEFSWEVDCAPGDTPPAGGCDGGTTEVSPGVFEPTLYTSLDVSGAGPQKSNNRYSDSKYNDRKITLTVNLPVNYANEYSGRTWWRIRYSSGASVTDRATWSIRVDHDPVRLLG